MKIFFHMVVVVTQMQVVGEAVTRQGFRMAVREGKLRAVVLLPGSFNKGQVVAVDEWTEGKKSTPWCWKARWVAHGKWKPWKATGAQMPWRAEWNRDCR